MILNSGIEAYIHSLLPPRDEVLAEMEAYAAEHNVPIIGPSVATMLAALVRLTGARRIFELGSAIGYSTIWLARAAGEGAEVHYSDGSPENAALALAYFRRAGVDGRITIHTGDALTALASTHDEFDFIFNDVDKHGYPAVLEAAPARLRVGGLFLTDNTLWHGKVLDPQNDDDHGVVEFNRNIFLRKDLDAWMSPLRDGVVVARKRY